jgi:hypothetical protein
MIAFSTKLIFTRKLFVINLLLSTLVDEIVHIVD